MNDVISKVKKLLALSESPNEHEARSALAKAQALMLEHELSMAEVESYDPEAGKYEEQVVREGSPIMPYETHFAGGVIQEFFFVEVFTRTVRSERTERLLFFGKPGNVETARHVFEYLAQTFRRLWDEFRTEHGLTSKEARSFYAGLVDGLTAKLRAERRQQKEAKPETANALVRIQSELRERFLEINPRVIEGKLQPISVDAVAYGGGIRRGQSIEVRKGLGGGEGEGEVEKERRTLCG